MGRRRSYDVRCPDCRMRREICICELIAACRRSVDSRTRIVILMHHRERCRTTNTARLAQAVLKDCEIRVRGLPETPLVTDGILDPSRQALLLFPTPDAEELTPAFVATLNKPVTLVVPDGTWGQAAKVPKREPFLRDVPRVKLPARGTSRYGLRRGSKENGLATFESIAIALGLLEGSAIQERLDELFKVMVQRTLLSRSGTLLSRHQDVNLG